MAAVRGMGVAVMTSTSGTEPSAPLARRAARCSTPKRCCSSTTTTPEGPELHPLLDEGVGAHEDVDGAVGEAGGDALALLGRGAVGEQLDAEGALVEQHPGVGATGHREAVEEPPDAVAVLVGEHLGGGHDRGLVPALDRGEHGGHGDHGLADADVALEQAVHRVGPGEVGGDLGDGVALAVGELEGQAVDEPPDQLAGRVVADAAGGALVGLLAQHQRELDPQQLVEHEPLAGDRVLLGTTPAGGCR